VSAPAGFEADAVESVPAAGLAGGVAVEDSFDEAGVADEVALVEVELVGVASDAGAWAPHGAAATNMSDARRAKR
jgi:hypothetical protein